MAAVGATGTCLEYPFSPTGYAHGALASLIAFPISQHVSVTAYCHLQYLNSLFDLRPRVNVLLLLCLFAEQAAICPP